MSRAPRRLLGALAVLFAAALGTITPAAAQGVDETVAHSATLVSQSPYVGADETFTMTLRLTGFDADDSVKVDVWGQPRALASRSQLRLAPTAEALTDIGLVKLRSPYSFTYGEVLDPSTGYVTLTLPVDRTIDEAGVYPLTVRADESRAEPLLLTTLIRLGPVDEAGPLEVAFVLPVTAAPGHTTDGGVVLDDGDRERLGALGALFTRALGTFPVTLEPGPETLDVIATGSTAGREEDGELLNLLRALAEDRHVLGGTYVPVDEEALRAVDLDLMVGDLQTAGARAIRDSGLGPIDAAIARIDSTDTPDTLTMRRQYGDAQYLLVPDDALEPLDDDGDAPAPLLQKFELEDSQGAAIEALATDTYLTALAGRLDDRGSDGPLLAQRFLADLVAGYRDDASIANRGTVVVLPADWDVTSAAVVDVLETIGEIPELHATDVGDVLRSTATADAEGSRANDSEPLVRQLRSTPPRSLGSYPSALARAERELRGFEAIAGAASGPVTADLERLRLISADERLDDAARARYLDAVSRAIQTRLRAPDGGPGLLGPGRQRVTMTSRRATIPIQLENRLGFPARVRLELQSEKLDFPDGSQREVTLAPGSNTIEVAVEATTSGDSILEVTVLPPDGAGSLGVLTEGTFTVRSTALSGVGLVISIVALGVLVVWWARHLLRSRRARAGGTGDDDPDGAAGTDSDDTDATPSSLVAAPTASLTRTEP